MGEGLGRLLPGRYATGLGRRPPPATNSFSARMVPMFRRHITRQSPAYGKFGWGHLEPPRQRKYALGERTA